MESIISSNPSIPWTTKEKNRNIKGSKILNNTTMNTCGIKLMMRKIIKFQIIDSLLNQIAKLSSINKAVLQICTNLHHRLYKVSKN